MDSRSLFLRRGLLVSNEELLKDYTCKVSSTSISININSGACTGFCGEGERSPRSTMHRVAQ